ncbi:Lipase 3 precursor, putative [Pediculus humanus corporis]|uniref:Lipase n=1 Tax=Pediculus humanus subsp. corporis TaxID=121224 RepID=E0V9B6_PEDHC|nr:Lipase 3 precursor, putative [Pediculus humanus corporis]EEB09972.1 Lipase 3 precursor, putative [Pediculus humanus corporis]
MIRALNLLLLIFFLFLCRFPPELVTKYGYPVETYTTTTEDGYLLTLYRIPYGKNCRQLMLKRPVLLQHGLLSSAFDFLITGPKKALGYILADNCFDVWLGNNRGNSLSRRHQSLKPTNATFWKFTWHEMGKYDLPALIDFILEKTQQKSLHYIGHSQGTTQFFVFGALYPEYHKKIATMHALSPVAYMKNLASPFIKAMTIFYKATEIVAELVGMHEFLPQSEFLNEIGRTMCHDKFPSLQNVCANVFFLLCGFDEPQLNRTILPAVLGHVPAGASTKQLIHYAQGISSGKFRHYDYGLFENLKIYDSIFPPDYNVSSINVPIALYYATNDWLASIKDVKQLESQLPNIINVYKVPYSKFNHLDFIYAIDAKFLLYDKVVEILNKYP